MDFSHPRLEKLTVAGPQKLSAKSKVVIALHGTGGSPHALVKWIIAAVGKDVTVIAPDAATVGRTRGWWHTRKNIMMAPDDEEFLSSLQMLDSLVEYVLSLGVPASRIALVGQSQGACLVLEYATVATHHRFAIVMGMSGGLVGTSPLARGAFAFSTADLHGHRIALSVHEQDAKVPLFFVRLTAAALERTGADVSLRIEPGSGHTMMEADAEILRETLAEMQAPVAEDQSERRTRVILDVEVERLDEAAALARDFIAGEVVASFDELTVKRNAGGNVVVWQGAG